MAKWFCEDAEYTQISAVDNDLRARIENVMKRYLREMEHYSYYSSNPGIPEDDLEDVAEDIMTELDLWENDNGL